MASALRSLSIPLPNGSRISVLLTLPFVLIHALALCVFFVKFRWAYLITCLALVAVRMFFVTAGYHRYFSHRSYQDQPRLSVCDRVHGHDLGAKGRAVVGRASPPSSSLFRSGSGPALADACLDFSGRTWAGSFPTNTTTRA